MGLYISGLKLPKKGKYTSFTVYSDGKVVFRFGGEVAGHATEVPPHGRLIDADAIPYKKIMYDDDDFYYGVTKPYIDRMPTIIPAEEET